MQDVIRYYEETWLDYRALWTDKRSRAMHFGYYADGAASHADALLNTNNVLANLARVTPGDHVLDAGCGVGGSSCWLAQHRGARCVGITPVPIQVRKARALAASRAVEHAAQFVCGDFTQTPFRDGAFEVVWALESLCHAPDKKRFYREAARATRSGGRLVVAEYMRSARPSSAHAEAMLRTWCAGWSMPDLDTVEEHRQAACDAGFTNVQVQDFTPVVSRSLRRLYRFARLAGPLDALLYGLKLRSARQHGNVVASRLQYEALLQGHWSYCILSANKP